MKIKILFYGFRHSHINTLYKKVSASDLFEIVDCVEENTPAREAAEKNLGASFSGRPYDEWLCEDIDVVAIGNAYGERGKVIIKALSAGKHIIADKPICTSVKELDEIEKLAGKNNLKIACMLDLRYIFQAIKAKEIIHSGELGEVRNVSFNGQHVIDYAHRPSWYFEKGMHGGTINDLAIHGIDLVRMISGLEFAGTDGARVWNSYAYKHEHFKDSALFMARLSNGAGVIADTSYSAPSQGFSLPTYWEFRFWCEKGLLTFSYTLPDVTVYKEGVSEPVIYKRENVESDYLSEFIDEINSGRNEMTKNILTSTRCALGIQALADSEVSK
ncbi:MAG: Gfo/Idh/MocA family oxidoreductase [Ruminococcaceae bacterium]|nr:Gfo/Idh/MocA family oxidoreductase [Oscillospiraceae bacterium]